MDMKRTAFPTPPPSGSEYRASLKPGIFLTSWRGMKTMPLALKKPGYATFIDFTCDGS